MRALGLRLRGVFRRLPESARGIDVEALFARSVTPAATVLVLLLVVMAIWALIEIPRWQINALPEVVLGRDRAKQFELENEARRTLTQIILGAFGLIALFLTWRRVRAGDRNVRILEQGHITDRFTKAIEQLGASEGKEPNIEVRLGGIYALERIAFDSARDHWTIMEVLTAYVRRNAPWTAGKAGTTGADSGQPDTGVKPRTDIQAILTVLGRRRRDRQREKGETLDLSGTDLRGVSLAGAHLEGASLPEAHLERADLGGAHLERADLGGAHLEWAYLFGANLEGADLAGAHLERANLAGAHLEGASLLEAHLERAYLREAHLERAYLGQAHLEGADLGGAHLEGASLRAAHLEGADLGGAHLEGAILRAAHLEGASLPEAHLEGAYLGGAHLKGAKGLTPEQVRSAGGWEKADYDAGFREQLGLPAEPADGGETGSAGA